MSFKGLEDKIKERGDTIYSRYNARDRGDGTQSSEPYIETKPNDPNKVDLGQQSRSVPSKSIRVDARRMAKFSTSTRGLQWYLDQAILQTGNAYSETRELNPAFVLGNVQPFVRIRRPLRAADENAGRLQQETAARATQMAISGEGGSRLERLASFIPPLTLINVASGINAIRGGGVLEENERPELDIDGEGGMYSVYMWDTVRKDKEVLDNVDGITKSLRRGDLVGAIRSVGRFFGSENGVEIGEEDQRNRRPGERYFIQDRETAIRYLNNTIDFTAEGPRVNLRIGKSPQVRDRGIRLADAFEREHGSGPSSNGGDPYDSDFPTASKQREAIDRVVQGFHPQSGFSSQISKQQIGRQLQNDLLKNAQEAGQTPIEEESGSVEDKMIEGGKFSLKNRYKNDGEWESLRESIRQQSDSFRDSLTERLNQDDDLGNMGYVGGITPGTEIADPKIEVAKVRVVSDLVNLQKIRQIKDKDATYLSDEEIVMDRRDAQPLIDFYIFDYVNKVAMPLRANLMSFTENVQTSYNDTPYIGRPERNVTYIGARRTAQFSFKAHAFNREELDNIWNKINYMTGLCFPAKYSSGFMVPPFTKITLGDIYNNQPGYIEAVSYNLDEGVPWETKVGMQVPHGMDITVTYQIIEKGQMKTHDWLSTRSGDVEDFIPFYSWDPDGSRANSHFSSPEREEVAANLDPEDARRDVPANAADIQTLAT